jgi:GT2 family glycosyltransferase/glycosyltransferase involved in cell wall biosynthesis
MRDGKALGRTMLPRWRRGLFRCMRRARFAFDLARLTLASGRARLARRSLILQRVTPVDSPVVFMPAAVATGDRAPVAFAQDTAPQVSILIPVYNHLDQTIHCLRSLAATATRCRFEVIVVDDASVDDSAEWLAACPGLRVHRMTRNSGFVDACNTGAALARGDYLVLLNNDTEVRAGWLDALIDTFAFHPDAGLVGAKLVYPDGTLQEAGGIVFADGNACNYGRGGNPSDPRYDFVREVDYCSGACIALPTALFQALGGFDRRYAPAYYEDTDLAFAVRQAGRRVLYQPAAEIVHFEGVTAGTDVAAGVKRYQQVNREKFVEKWYATLQAQPRSIDFSTAPERCANRQQGPRVLVVDMGYPQPDRDSGSLRMFTLLQLMRKRGCAVVFWAVAGAPDAYARTLQQHGIELVQAQSGLQSLQWWYRHGSSLDVVMLSRLPVASMHLSMARAYAAQARLIFDTVDLHFLRAERAALLADDAVALRAARRMRQDELALMRKADVTLVVSDYESKLLRGLLPDIDVRILSNVHVVEGSDAPFEARSGMLFLGNFEHAPNVDGARWLVDEVMPHVRRHLPHLILHIVGFSAHSALADCRAKGVRIHDHVADLAPIFREVRLALAPLRFGAGVKGKINMAMSYGVPVVSTTIGAEGMDLQDHRDVLIADDAALFAAAIVELDGDPKLWAMLSMQGLENVRRHFSPEAADRVLGELLG